MTDRRCETKTTTGARCKCAAIMWRKHEDGREYLVCTRHWKEPGFKPIQGGGQLIPVEPVGTQPPVPKKNRRTSPPPAQAETSCQGPRTVSYLRVSTSDQNTEKNQHAVSHFANQREFGRVEFIEETVSGKKGWRERKLGPLVDLLATGDRLIVPELTRLGRSTLEVLEILAVTKAKGVAVYSVKEGLELNGDSMQSKVMSTMLALFAELEREFISLRTKEALKARKAAGVKLGRRPGPGKSKLDPHRENIIEDLQRGVPKTRIAKRYGATEATLHNWLKKNEVKLEAKS